MLLDDVMSELDPDRRDLLAHRLAEGDGQALMTATEPGQLPAAWDRTEFGVTGGALERSAAPPRRPALAA